MCLLHVHVKIILVRKYPAAFLAPCSVHAIHTLRCTRALDPLVIAVVVGIAGAATFSTDTISYNAFSASRFSSAFAPLAVCELVGGQNGSTSCTHTISMDTFDAS